jgi:hypothetical protein
MRLLRCDDHGFEEADDQNIPPYAILSHTWYPDHQEITYQEMCNGPDKQKLGYLKIGEYRRIAKANGYNYFWVDTCCIHKSSSAELSEAINSMFK